MKKIKKLVLNALVLTCTSFLLRTVGVGYNIYISNKIGAEAMGLFTLILSVYSFALTLATSGIFIAATRLVSVALGKNDPGEVRAAMRKCFIYGLSFGIASGLLLLSFARPIGVDLLKDERTVSSLKILALTLPLISMSTAMNGYFTSVRRAYKNALSQVFEQGIKIPLTACILSLASSDGIEAACKAIVSSGAVSELCSFLFTYFLYLHDKRKFIKSQAKKSDEKNLTRDLLSVALPVAFSSYARSGLSTAEHILIPRGLEKNGASRERSLAAYGTLQSMVLPIVLFPSAIIGSFSGLLVPELTECKVQKNHTQINYIVCRVFQLTLFFSVGVAGILICFSGELGLNIYNSSETGRFIRWIAPLVPVMYTDTSADAMLKGLGEQLYCMKVNIIDSALGVVFALILLPWFGIYGYIALIYICETVNAALSISRLLCVTDFKPHLFRFIFGPLLCIGGATGCMRFCTMILHFPHPSYRSGLVFSMIFTALIYFIFAIITGCISRDDVKWLVNLIKK